MAGRWPGRSGDAGSTLLQGCQASRGGDSPQGFPLEASEARSAAGAQVREGLEPNGRDDKGGTGAARKPGGALRRHAQAVQCAIKDNL